MFGVGWGAPPLLDETWGMLVVETCGTSRITFLNFIAVTNLIQYNVCNLRYGFVANDTIQGMANITIQKRVNLFCKE